MEQQTMKAVVRDVYGSVDVLRLGEVDKPVAGEGEVLVRACMRRKSIRVSGT